MNHAFNSNVIGIKSNLSDIVREFKTLNRNMSEIIKQLRRLNESLEQSQKPLIVYDLKTKAVDFT